MFQGSFANSTKKSNSMLEVPFIRNNRETVEAGLRKRNWTAEAMQIIDQILATDDARKKYKTELDQLQSSQNKLAKDIGPLLKQGKSVEADQLKVEVASLKEQGSATQQSLKEAEEALEELLLAVPNIPHNLVVPGKSAEDNEVYKAWDKPMPELPGNALPHWELAQKYQLFDLELGVKITGAGFPVYRGKGAQLQRALINFFLARAAQAGYEEIQPPLLVNAETAKATGQLPDKEGQMYYVERDELYLIPTAEVPVTNILRDVILDEKEFPVKMTGYTPCFRREAGSYGAHVRGINRVHQFDKVEIVQVQRPDKSYDTLHEMLDHVSALLDELGLPYRILRLCGGDMSFGSAMTYDFEVFSAAQKLWLEVSSVSNFETFQSNRLRLRYRDAEGKRHLAHTLNGSALALARIFAALLENYQTADGIEIPEVLRPYTGFDKI
jgi:seryl-tRNA synthetase